MGSIALHLPPILILFSILSHSKSTTTQHGVVSKFVVLNDHNLGDWGVSVGSIRLVVFHRTADHTHDSQIALEAVLREVVAGVNAAKDNKNPFRVGLGMVDLSQPNTTLLSRVLQHHHHLLQAPKIALVCFRDHEHWPHRGPITSHNVLWLIQRLRSEVSSELMEPQEIVSFLNSPLPAVISFLQGPAKQSHLAQHVQLARQFRVQLPFAYVLDSSLIEAFGMNRAEESVGILIIPAQQPVIWTHWNEVEIAALIEYHTTDTAARIATFRTVGMALHAERMNVILCSPNEFTGMPAHKKLSKQVQTMRRVALTQTYETLQQLRFVVADSSCKELEKICVGYQQPKIVGLRFGDHQNSTFNGPSGIDINELLISSAIEDWLQGEFESEADQNIN